eukprot:2828389-Prymnesium_polylepis.1
MRQRGLLGAASSNGGRRGGSPLSGLAFVSQTGTESAGEPGGQAQHDHEQQPAGPAVEPAAAVGLQEPPAAQPMKCVEQPASAEPRAAAARRAAQAAHPSNY